MENKNITVDTLIGDLYKNDGLLSTENNIEKHINNINKNYIDNNLNENLNNFNDNRPTPFNDDNIAGKSTSYFYYFILLFIFIILFLVVFYFRDNIKHYFNKGFNILFKDNILIKNETPYLKRIKKSIQNEKYRTKVIKKRKVSKKSFKDLEDNISNKIRYNKNKLADYDGYCYIGYDNGQRECTEIDKGDVCLSGEIFPSQEICMMPKLRE